MSSIRRFLTVALCAVLTLGTLIAGGLSYQDATHEVEELFDAELAQMARVLQSLISHQLQRTQLQHLREALVYQDFRVSTEESELEPEALPGGHRYEKKLAFQIWNEAQELLITTDTPARPLSFSSAPGYGEEALGRQRWRTFVLHDAQLGLWIKVAQRDDVRRELTDEIVLHNLLPFLIMIPLLALVIGTVVRRGLAPLMRVSGQITSRSPENLEPLHPGPLPEEISGVVSATNRLLEKLALALERERRFTADAAHELRTPLAAIRIHTQNLCEGARPEQQQSLSQLLAGIDRMSRGVEQLLTLSRLEHQQSRQGQSTELTGLLQTLLAERMQAALAKPLQVELDDPGKLWVRADRGSLEILFSNLLDNALKYTPAGGRVQVRVRVQAQQVQVTVLDSGAGIPVAERERVFDRFYRLAGQEQPGSGLGLAIARQVVQQLGGELHLAAADGSLTADGPGLAVTVGLPQAGSP